MILDKLEVNTIAWANDRGLLKKENSQAQMCKVIEEVGETAAALLKGNREALKDGIGDSLVTLAILAAQNNLTLAECWNNAYNEIVNRKGTTVNGTFIKEG
jgi:NTP pyrophosphatase (non-canonical NTP hydrolase)